MPEKEPCAFCGSIDWVEAHFTCGRLVCRTCHQGSEPAKAQPVSDVGRRQLELWCQPRPQQEGRP